MATPQWAQITEWSDYPATSTYSDFGLDYPWKDIPNLWRYDFHSQEQTWDGYPPDVIWTILDGDGTPVEGAILTIGGTDYTTDASGQVEIGSLAQGEYTVGLSKSGYLSYEWTERLHTGAAIEYRTVELLTLDQAGMPVAADVEAGVSYADGARTGTFVGSSHFTSVSVSVPSVEVEVG